MEESKQPIFDTKYQKIIDRLGFGRYQIILFLAIGCGIYADGIEVVFMSVLSYVFMDIWNLSSAVVSLHASFVFMGKCIGILISGVYGDDYGRITMCKISFTLISVSYIVSPLMPDFYSFIVSRMFTGMGIGFLMPVFAGYLMENFPSRHQSISVVIIMSIMPLGEVFIIFWIFVLLPGLDGNNWRYLFPICLVYIVISTILVYIYLKESAMFLLKQGRIVESTETLNFIARSNNLRTLNSDELDCLHSTMITPGEKGLEKIRIIFQERYSKVTCLLLVIWSSTQVMYFGFFIILPITLSSGGGSLTILLGWTISALVQLPFYVVNAMLLKKFGSRGVLLISTSGLIFFEGMSILLVGSNLFILCVVGLTAFGVMLFGTMFAYTNEVYSSEIRSMATGFFNIIANLVGIFVPIVVFSLNEIENFLPFAFMGIFALLAFGAALLLPDPIKPSKS